MTKRDVTVCIPAGLDASSVAMLVQIASRYDSKIYIEAGEKHINAKSIMGMMSLKLAEGSRIAVTGDGVDEEAALKDVVMYLSAE